MELLLIGALLIESVVESFKVAFDKGKFSYTYIGSLLLGIAGCLVYSLDLFALAGLETAVPYVGSVLSGLVLGRGSNFVSDIIGKLRGLSS